jgi:uncharacterized protein YeaO (DUF488 family)
MTVKIKRIYEKKETTDGYGVLVDRLWPRGVKKTRIHLWLKEIAPSEKLRKWYNHDEKKWKVFKKLYVKELNKNKEMITLLLKLEKEHHTITLLYASKSIFNNAAVLFSYLQKLKEKIKNL